MVMLQLVIKPRSAVPAATFREAKVGTTVGRSVADQCMRPTSPCVHAEVAQECAVLIDLLLLGPMPLTLALVVCPFVPLLQPRTMQTRCQAMPLDRWRALAQALPALSRLRLAPPHLLYLRPPVPLPVCLRRP